MLRPRNLILARLDVPRDEEQYLTTLEGSLPRLLRSPSQNGETGFRGTRPFLLGAFLAGDDDFLGIWHGRVPKLDRKRPSALENMI